MPIIIPLMLWPLYEMKLSQDTAVIGVLLRKNWIFVAYMITGNFIRGIESSQLLVTNTDDH